MYAAHEKVEKLHLPPFKDACCCFIFSSCKYWTQWLQKIEFTAWNVTQTKQPILAFLPSICVKEAINQWMKFLPGTLWSWGMRFSAPWSSKQVHSSWAAAPEQVLNASSFNRDASTLEAYLALSFLSQMHFTCRLARRWWQAQTVSQCFCTSVPTWMSCHLVQELIHTLKTRAMSSRMSVNSISQLLSNQTHSSFFMMQLDSWDCGLG